MTKEQAASPTLSSPTPTLSGIEAISTEERGWRWLEDAVDGGSTDRAYTKHDVVDAFKAGAATLSDTVGPAPASEVTASYIARKAYAALLPMVPGGTVLHGNMRGHVAWEMANAVARALETTGVSIKDEEAKCLSCEYGCCDVHPQDGRAEG